MEHPGGVVWLPWELLLEVLRRERGELMSARFCQHGERFGHLLAQLPPPSHRCSRHCRPAPSQKPGCLLRGSKLVVPLEKPSRGQSVRIWGAEEP